MAETAPTAQEWLHGYALLALRINRQISESTGPVLIYQGPPEWSAEARGEDPPPAGKLVEDAERLLDDLPFEPRRAAYLAAQVRALRAVARRLAGEELPLGDYASECLGVESGWVPEAQLESAHAQLDRALPRTSGSLTERLHAWQAAHTLARTEELPKLVDEAVAETRARTSRIVPLPEGEVVECQLAPGPHRGYYAGGLRSTILIGTDLPFNLADLLYVVAHEGHPGHIAEQVLKDVHLAGGQGRLEQRIRFLLSPPFVLSEGLGLHAQSIAFPGDQAQAWLTDNVLAEQGIRPDGSDFAAIHDAKTALFGAWGNAALLAGEGRPDAEVAAYLSRWALLDEDEVAAVRGYVGAPGMSLYLFGYYFGWRLVGSWLNAPDRTDRVRRLLTEQLLPADLR